MLRALATVLALWADTVIVVHARILVQRWRKSGILDLNSFLCITKSDKEDGKSAYTAWAAYLTRPTDDAPIFTWSTTPTELKVDNAVDPQPDIESKIDELIELCLQPDPKKLLWQMQRSWFSDAERRTSWITKVCRGISAQTTKPDMVVTDATEDAN